MSKRLEKKKLHRKIFDILQNINQCHPDGYFDTTPIPSVKFSTYYTPDTRFDPSMGMMNEHYRLAEKFGNMETKARQFLRDVEKHHSAQSINRAMYSWGPEFDGCETGHADALEFYLQKIDALA